MSIPLCVPFELKDEAKQAGARWHPVERVWACDCKLLHSAAYAILEPFVPDMYRRGWQPPYVVPCLVPQTVWGRNLRSVLPKEEWDVVRRAAYRAAGSRCRICGGRGPNWPVEADEVWHYDDGARTHTLMTVVALCPNCHHVRHWGKTRLDGREPEALAHASRINGWADEIASAVVRAAFDTWQARSAHRWISNFDWVTRTHGFVIEDAGIARSESANQSLIQVAKCRA